MNLLRLLNRYRTHINMKKIALLAVSLFMTIQIWGQERSTTYYLPDIKYDKDITTPVEYFGFQIGDWHLSHYQQLSYMRQLAEESPRVSITEYGKTHEGRPLVYLTITSEKNQGKIKEIQADHLKLLSDEKNKMNTADMPAVIYQGFSIHGNEASGGNAAPLVAYYLAAAKSKEVDKILDEVVVLLDPCMNPDGFNRFASWVNVHKNKHITSENEDREYHEVWPGGRTNHYWFDLNRDWLPVQHPESQGRINTFQAWKPNVLTDYHEMGTHTTFFFMPGEQTRVHPLTPKRNQELTHQLANYHADALDEIGSLYFTGERFDDFYYGKGSTYPDVNGCVGILLEQASARGHSQDTKSGGITFPFAIRNQVRAALAVQVGTKELAKELLDFQRDFYNNARKEAASDNEKGYVFTTDGDYGRISNFVEILRRHNIDIHHLGERITVGEEQFETATSFVVPLEQDQYRLVKSIFEQRTTFTDSIFYDVSAWTLPLAFDMRFASLKNKDYSKKVLGRAVEGLRPDFTITEAEYTDYAYVFKWEDYYAPKLLNTLLNKGLYVRVGTTPFSIDNQRFDGGSIIVPIQNQPLNADQIYQLIKLEADKDGVEIFAMDSGYASMGPSMGSPSTPAINAVKVLMVVGEGVESYDAGAMWHLLDQEQAIVLSKVEQTRLTKVDLQDYNVIIMPNGTYGKVTTHGKEELKRWVRKGGTLIAVKGAANWCASQGWTRVHTKSKPGTIKGRRAYKHLDRDEGSNVIGGAILEAKVDLSHPLLFGMKNEQMPLFKKGSILFKQPQNAYAAPLIYEQQPLLAGYMNKSNKQYIENSAAVIVSGLGKGRVISFADSPAFRGFWQGTSRLLTNAIFFGSIIDKRTTE